MGEEMKPEIVYGFVIGIVIGLAFLLTFDNPASEDCTDVTIKSCVLDQMCSYHIWKNGTGFSLRFDLDSMECKNIINNCAIGELAVHRDYQEDYPTIKRTYYDTSNKTSNHVECSLYLEAK